MNLVLRLSMLCGGPGAGVDHDREPSHHPAPQHVAEVLDAGCGPLFDVAFEHGGGKNMAGVVECPAVRQWIVGIGNGKVVAMRCTAKVNHPPAISADFEQQSGMIVPQ